MKLPVLLCAGFLWLGAWTVFAQDAPMSRAAVEEALTCQCGCGLTVHACNHLQCSFAIPVREDIAESMERGETGQQILARYREKYGEKVLSSPIATGFNLLAWVGPYVAVGLGAIFIVVAIRRMARAPAPGLPAAPKPADLDRNAQQRLARLRKEMEDMEQ